MRILITISALLLWGCGDQPTTNTAGDEPAKDSATLVTDATPHESPVTEPEPAATNEDAAPIDDDVEGGVFFDATGDAATNSITIHLPAPGTDGVMLRAIHAASIAAGLGSNPVGMDRGYSESGRVIAFRRVGDKVVIEQENTRYRASANNDREKQAVRDSFAKSILWVGDIEEDNGRVSFDIAPFLTTDVMNLSGWFAGRGQGKFSIDAARSFADAKSVLAFPNNVEIDAVVTLTSSEPGDQVAATAADARTPTLTIHHSFVRLPDAQYQTRNYDPRAGAIDVAYYDFSAALDEPILKKVARRFRLERVDPNAASGPVKKPITFYVDRGAPEQVRNALIEGANWWAEAFAEAGFEDAFHVELLPEGAHPLDVRYNTIQWVHRQTRGWSYGGGVVDPRTGEMISGRVILGSQRVRQDRMIFEGLIGAGKSGSGAADDPVELALARIRQLSAHEVGHPLGFEHNFAASSIDRASVMDYPAPFVRPREDGSLDVSNAYAVGVGEWDKFTVKWLYSQFSDGTDEDVALNQIVEAGYDAGLRFVADVEGRSVGTANPDGSVWDNGSDPVAALQETLAVRAIALENFGLNVIKSGQDTSSLRATIVPIYLYHRYQIAAATKLIGGYRFNYALNGDGREGGVPVSVERQTAALRALVETLDPEMLDLPDSLLNLLTPPVATFTSFESGEYFDGNTGPVFDVLNAADAAGAITISALLHPDRVARLIELNRRGNDSSLAFKDVLGALEAQLFSSVDSRHEPIQHRLQSRYLDELITLAHNGTPETASLITGYLRGLRNRITPGLLDGQTPNRAHREWLVGAIERYLNRPAKPAEKDQSVSVPAGSPIGAAGFETCWHC